jgi:hypothetical protein
VRENERILGNKVEKSEKLTQLRMVVVVAADGGGSFWALCVLELQSYLEYE